MLNTFLIFIAIMLGLAVIGRVTLGLCSIPDLAIGATLGLILAELRRDEGAD